MFTTLLHFRAVIISLLVVSVVIGCSKKSDDPSPGTATNSAAVGNWKFSALKVDPAVAVGLSGTTVVTATDLLPYVITSTGSSCISDVTITFKSDGTISSDTPKSCQSSTVSDATGISSTSKWSLNNGKMTITESDGTATVYDTTISSSTMSLAYKQDDTDPLTNKKVTYTYTLQLRKV